MQAGCTSGTLEAFLGAPEATGGTSRRQRRPVIWKYGDMEFYFDGHDGELSLVHLDRFSGTAGFPEGWGGLEIEPWVIKEGLPCEVFLAALGEAGLRYTIRPDPQFNQKAVVLASGVEVGFICQPEPYSPPVGLAWLSRRLAKARPPSAIPE